ncbi:sodium:proton antiporter NhaD [Haliscomenobacter hydrossis]|uniref:Citrate transporter n=1 Tax=Haliscomenobacter hydrossis (strain ATCC 27775 / DSM 1100 / LMG 10767 / O) TaxID=760192 RepID=F4L4X4_HALH1|nr:sodium:proton antiporter NhaD [Haliscomenobacter hydrossis]AEE54036.1 Citrate transporter [Haliscomenobacter hydrossis DSM 1100]
MELLTIIVFVVGYLLIALEHNVHIDKAATAIITGVLCWTLYSLSGVDTHHLSEHLGHHLSNIAGILFFLIGAMTIVELIDAHEGFEVITQQIRTRDKRQLLWTVGVLTFFLSAILDNLTTTIVMVVLLKKLISSPKDRLYFISAIVLAANAGGAWSPIGDVTTTMLWIGGQLSAGNIVLKLILPSLASLLIAMLLIGWQLKGSLNPQEIEAETSKENEVSPREKKLILVAGVFLLLMVPVYKMITHLPPYMGMLLALGILWLLTELLHHDKEHGHKRSLSVLTALQRMDMPSILFFLGILLAVSALETQGTLPGLAQWLNTTVGNMDVVVIITGILSAIVDNVPLVAAAMGMYPLADIPADSRFWEMLAYCAGTGGSMLIIGSAAGVAAMGLEKITFGWYLQKITWIALLSYFAGIGVYYLQSAF